MTFDVVAWLSQAPYLFTVVFLAGALVLAVCIVSALYLIAAGLIGSFTEKRHTN
jgi:hypothetical protein